MEKTDELNLSNIKKIIAVSTGYSQEYTDRCVVRVNKLLDSGWVLLEVQKCDYDEPGVVQQRVTYHLGHADQQAETFEHYDFLIEREESIRESLR
jgi:hypothetical protein